MFNPFKNVQGFFGKFNPFEKYKILRKFNQIKTFQIFFSVRLVHFEHFSLFGEVKPTSDLFGKLNPFTKFKAFSESLAKLKHFRLFWVR